MTRIAWLLYGSIEERTGGTIYDRIVIDGLRARGFAVDIVDPRLPMRRLLAAEVLVGDELCFREIAEVFPSMPLAKRVLLVHHLTCWEEERPRAERQRARLHEAKALRAADRIVTTSHTTRARLEREGARPRIDVVWPGCDRLARVARASATTGTRFLFVGSVTARKRVRELVLALPPRATLRVVGSIAREDRYAESVRRLADTRGAVAFLGEVDDTTLARELASADALVMPSSLEGYGIAATEAIHAGMPVIAARTPGLEEALAPCPDAVLFARSDSDAFARVLHDFSSDSALRERMGAAAKRARLPTWAEAVRGFEAALQSAIEVPRT